MNSNNIIITGGAGFIGSNLVEYMMDHTDYNLIVLDKLTYAGDLKNIQQYHKNPRFSFIEGDINNSYLVEAIFHAYHPIGIFHLAAESHVDNSINNANDFIRTNINGTYNLLDVSRKYIAEERTDFRFLHVSTDEVYGSLLFDGERFNENSLYHPNSPYSASKAASDHLVTAYHETFGLDTIITHCSNNYGPRQHVEKLIPKVIHNALKRELIPIYGDGKNIRDWIHVKDHCRALLEVFQRGSSGESYCIGGNNELTNLEIVKEICDCIRKITNTENQISLVKMVPDRLGHDFRYAIDSRKMFVELEWEPEISFKQGLKSTIEWYINTQGWL